MPGCVAHFNFSCTLTGNCLQSLTGHTARRIALYEELIRVFILTELWKWSSRVFWSIAVIFISAIIIGLAHWSQGSYGIVTIGIKSLVSGYFFFRKRTLMPLVYAHVLYDGIQVAMLLLTYP